MRFRRGETNRNPYVGFLFRCYSEPKLDEASGATTAADSAGTNTGTLYGGATWQPPGGKSGGALLFDEANDYVLVSDFAYGPEFTLAFWYKPTDNAGSYFQYLFSHRVHGAANSMSIFCQEEGGVDPDLDVVTMAVKVPETVGHLHCWSVQLTRSASPGR